MHSQGEDSFVGTYVGDAIELTFDFGYEHHVGGPDDCPKNVECRNMVVDEKDAMLITRINSNEDKSEYIDGPYLVSVYFKDFQEPNLSDMTLVMHATCMTAEDALVAKEIFLTVRFREMEQPRAS